MTSEHVPEYTVDIACGERTNEQDEKSTSLTPVDGNGNEKKDVLGAKNDQGITPLHSAASDHNSNKEKDNLRNAAMNGNWYEVLDMYKEKRELRMAKITKGDTVLHMAVSGGKEYVVGYMVDLVEEDEKSTPLVCGARADEQDEKPTPSVCGVRANVQDEKSTPSVCGARANEQDEKSTPSVCGARAIEQDEKSTASVCGARANKQDEKSKSLPLVNENGNEKKDVLGAKNDQGNTPLHLAASSGNVRMCKKIAGKHLSLIAIRNHAGETPLFLAAFHGHRKAFLCLHYLYENSSQGSSTRDALYKKDGNDTILHYAMAGGHIDVAIEIVFLYKYNLKEMMMRDKNGLTPLHILAVTPSALESTDLVSRSYVVQKFYHWFLRVKKKERATSSNELEQRERKTCVSFLHHKVRLCLYGIYFSPGPYWVKKIRRQIFYSLDYLSRILLFPLFALDYLFTPAGNWFHGIRNMKEKHTWSLQIMQQLLSIDSCKLLFDKTYEEESDAGSKVVDTPLMIAAKNGLIEMVEEILKKFPYTINYANKDGKNIVLLAAEKRQTNLYHILYGNEKVDKSLFRKMDKDGNTALHLAAKFGVNLDMQATTMVEELKWFEFVERSVPPELWEKYNKDGNTAREIFWDSYEEHMKSDRKWLNQTSQTCSVASTLVAAMAFSNIVEDNFDKKNISSLLLALSLSLTSTISFLAILAFRSQSLKFWKYAPFMIQIAILTMFGSIVALWISLMLNGHSLATYAILGTPIAILTIVSLPIFIGPSLMSLFTKIPPPSRKTTSAIYYQRPQKQETDSNPQNEEIAADSNLKKRKMWKNRISK